MRLLPAFLTCCSVAIAYSTADYDEGKVHDRLMSLKTSFWKKQEAQGKFDSRKWLSWGKWKIGKGKPDRDNVVRCKNGLAIAEPGDANQTFRCKNVGCIRLQIWFKRANDQQMDLYDFLSHADLGSPSGEGSSSWGWVSRDGREFAAIGQFDGTAFVEITKKGKMKYLGRLPQQSVPSQWREIRVLGDHVIIGSEAVGHGVQVFDMKKLLNIDPRQPKLFSPVTDLTGLYNKLPIGRTHNIVVNWDLDYAIAVGAQPRNDSCRSGLIFLDVSDPSNPTSPGCASGDGYVHDAQCVKYRGPDTRYLGRDICVGFNEDTVTVYDVTSKSGNPSATILSRTPYVGASYTHQGWFVDSNWHQYMLVDDELDEIDGVGPAADGYPVTFIFDLSDLEHPVNTGQYKCTDVKSIDHNLYVHDGLAYQSNYGAGLWVHDVSGIPRDPSGGNVEAVGFFDIYPEDDSAEGGGLVEFVGTWSHYKFPSGYTLVNTIERGAFVVKLNGKQRGKYL